MKNDSLLPTSQLPAREGGWPMRRKPVALLLALPTNLGQGTCDDIANPNVAPHVQQAGKLSRRGHECRAQLRVVETPRIRDYHTYVWIL